MSVPLAFPHPTEPVFGVEAALWEQACAASRTSPRRRMAVPIHRTLGDAVQRMLNILQPGTYIAPHYHPAEGFCETICVLQGVVGFLEFDQTGHILQTRRLQGGTPEMLVDFIGPRWHAFVCLAEDTVVLEIKKGPYVAASDKVFAPWAPTEGSVEAEAYLRGMEAPFYAAT